MPRFARAVIAAWILITTGAHAAPPNIVVVMTDDQGYGDLGVHANPVISTPRIDALAGQSASVERFYVSPVCTPTRACLLTGRNHHSVGMRAISNFDTGFPNMRGRIAPSAATLAEVLEPIGYHTMMAGKWHLAPMREASATSRGG